MQITELTGSSGYQTYIHLALDDAVAEYQKVQSAVAQQPPLTEETVTPELAILHYSLEQKRVTAILLVASCVEAVANLYLGLKSTPEQFVLLERATFIEKWTVLPSLFVSGYTFPKDGDLYQDLKRIHVRRNAIAHLKEKVSFGGVILHQGSLPESAGDEHVFLGRCRSLPKRLVSHLASFDKTEALRTIQMILAAADTFREMRRTLILVRQKEVGNMAESKEIFVHSYLPSLPEWHSEKGVPSHNYKPKAGIVYIHKIRIENIEKTAKECKFGAPKGKVGANAFWGPDLSWWVSEGDPGAKARATGMGIPSIDQIPAKYRRNPPEVLEKRLHKTHLSPAFDVHFGRKTDVRGNQQGLDPSP